MSVAFLAEMLLEIKEDNRQSVKECATELTLHYALNSQHAVRLWREGIESCLSKQVLALIYVVNEVQQTTKQSLWPQILEDFSVMIPKMLRLACEKAPHIVEEVKRIGTLHHCLL